ncbi:helix-turn-helix domain-containing protein [Actinomadura rupiterrae]|uniref:helix-turn-helix domain-containing protein n=1 Tax=Actinomadura rupiterrae TaxID=559627 RepID=UPI0020A38CA0|nr:helix-turn-helix transcriptional regulator [Actinomadura rupiterrae]MCP2343840.1 transcriptional regulator with XRE-family HTH domain [Actinomadura rupiterrae]
MATHESLLQLPDPRANLWDFSAHYLRQTRKRKGLSGEALGRALQISKSKVSRIERGEERLDLALAEKADQALGTVDLFVLLVWYASFGHDPEWFPQYVKFEQQATWLRLYEADVISGLFQTEEYARALVGSSIASDVERVVMRRLQRQEMLAREQNPPSVSLLMSQNALDWPVGSPRIMREQLGHLLEAAEWAHVMIRIVPRSWECGAHAGLAGSFQLITGEPWGEAAYTDAPGTGRLVASPAEVLKYALRYERISGSALSVERSTALIRQVMEAFRD